MEPLTPAPSKMIHPDSSPGRIRKRSNGAIVEKQSPRVAYKQKHRKNEKERKKENDTCDNGNNSNSKRLKEPGRC